ncbi:MAG: hypothetical protein HY979_02060, partial [Candidatus Magasanikbacteria bacterium]|nr:hypothetical protein [Candidatus Magasanikbacteria bacterium]
ALYESTDFSVDTAAPLGLLSLSKFAGTTTSVTMNWSAGITDAHFSHYELWHGSVLSDVTGRTGTATKWSPANDAGLNSIATISTIITGLNISGNYYVKIWAIDDYGNETTVTEVNVFTPVPVAVTETPGASGFNLPPVVAPNSPVLEVLATPTKLAKLTIAGLADSTVNIDLYDNDGLLSRLEKTSNASGQFNQTFTFTEGHHVIKAKAADNSGNSSAFSASIDLVVDLTPPAAPLILSPQEGLTVEKMLEIVGLSEPLAQVEIVLDKKDTFTVSANLDGNWNLNIPNVDALKTGRHNLAFKVVDAAGNIGPEVKLTIDLIAPVVRVEPTPVVTTPVVVTPGISAPIAPVTPVVTPVTSVVAPTTPTPPASLVSESVTAVELPGVPVPAVTKVNTVATNNTFTFSGTALPNQEVLIYLHSDQALIYRTKADSAGNWAVNHSQEVTELTPGEHTVYAVALEPGAKIKSKPSPVSTFTVSKNFWVSLFESLNLKTTIVTLSTLFICIFWLYWLKRKGMANV